MRAGKTPWLHVSGFTLVELVITLVLIGILSALGIGLLASPSTYSAGAARDQFVSTALLAQKHALAGAPSSTIDFSYERDGNNLVFLVERDGSELARRTADASDVTASPSSLGLEFDSAGRLVSSDGQGVSFTAASTHNACISSLGFPYAGDCKP